MDIPQQKQPGFIVSRPLPIVFEDYEDEQYQDVVGTDNKHSDSLKKVSSTPINVYITTKIHYPTDGLILMELKDAKYLRQGIVFPEAIDGITNLKRVAVMILATIKAKGIKGRIGTLLAYYCWIADWMFMWYDPNSNKMRKLFYKPNRYRQSVQGLIKLVNNFIANIGIKVYDPSIGPRDFGKVLGTEIEHDNAYYWRLEDIFGIINKQQLLDNPRKEIKRVVAEYKKREQAGIEFKVETIGKILNYALLIPKIKKAFKEAIQPIDFEKMKMTNNPPNSGLPNDLYFCLLHKGYDFGGMSLGERIELYKVMSNGILPPKVTLSR